LLNDPRTVLDNSPTQSFTITNADGTSPTFKGIIVSHLSLAVVSLICPMKVKYVPEKVIQNNRDSSFTVLEPGQTKDVTHDRTSRFCLGSLISQPGTNIMLVGSFYDFGSSGAGDYNFEPFNRFQHVSPSGELTEILADHQPTNLKIGGLLSKPVDTTTGLHQKRATFTGCSSEQQTGIKKAIEMAQSSALDTAGYVQCQDSFSPPDSPHYSYSNALKLVSTERYETWFGEFEICKLRTLR
jgi:peptidyl-Lys metalloendopeptidase